MYWVYTGYRLRIWRKARRREILTLRLWSSEEAPQGWMWQEYTIHSGQELLAVGRLESCLLDLQTGHRCKNPPISIPKDSGCPALAISSEPEVQTQPLPEACFQHQVRFSDLDASLHLNNLRVVQLFLDAFSASELGERTLLEFSIRYDAQCFEGDTVAVHRLDSTNRSYLALTRPGGTLAAHGVIQWQDAENRTGGLAE